MAGAALFAHQWAQPTPAFRTGEAERLALQGEEITRLVREEHDLVVEYLKVAKERESARAPLSISEMKARELAARRVAEPAREARAELKTESKTELKPLAPPLPPPSVVAAAPAPGPEIATAAAAPVNDRKTEPKEPGGVARVAGWAFEWADKAVDLTGLRHVPGLVRTITGLGETPARELQTMSDARLIGTE
jgi:hypothetical protein